jgi:hypothetical protein
MQSIRRDGRFCAKVRAMIDFLAAPSPASPMLRGDALVGGWLD